MLTIVTGAVAGFVHVLAGPDHLAAVTPMAVAGRERGWVSGWIFDLTASYRAAFAMGFGANLLNLAIAVYLLLRLPKPRMAFA